MIKSIGVLFGGFVMLMLLVFTLAFMGNGLDLAQYSFWAPKQQAVERKVFIETPSFVIGKNNFIAQLRLEYESSDDSNRKKALKNMILAQADQIKFEQLSDDNQALVLKLKREY